ncbi:hypothetical protein BUALT_Bualt04G0001300 [Buddleja alternifolia]|uniref:Uncharacterized protein n=1 Tax=Buddleja alternifolia TaxID=168488 RepID=A0AAV6XPC1_9LAMI|nr:hypothetical protein BUALT_Bualt04G0001300 [Buddleja alternifolia]
MSTTPNRRLHEDGGNGSGGGSGSGSGNHGHPSVLKYPHDDQGTYSGLGGKVSTSARHDYHAPYDMGQEGRMPKIAPRNDLRDADRRPPLLPNMLFRVPTPNDSHSDHVGSQSRMEYRDSKDSIKENKFENRDMKSESRESHLTAKSDKYDSRADDSKNSKHDRDTYSELKVNEKLDKDTYGSHSQLNWKDMKEQNRVKQYHDAPGGNAETWYTSRTSLHGPVDAAKEGLHVDNRDFAEAREAVGENKVDMKDEDKLKDRDRKRKEVKHWDWGERDKERSDRRNTLQPGNSSNENKDVVREEKDPERWGNEKKEPFKEKEKQNEKDHVKRELWDGSDKETSHNEKELVDIPGKYVELESSALEPLKKDHETWKNVDREARDRKKDRDADVEPERPDKRSRHHEKESDEGGLHAEGGTEREREAFSSGVQQRKRMLRPRGSPQMGNREPRVRPCGNDNEGSQGKADVSCVVYKIGECMQELIKLWKEYELLQADKASEGSQNGPTLEIRIPAEHVTATNRQVRGGQLWGTDIYTVDSDLVAGYCRPTASPPPSATQELRATIRVLPPQDYPDLFRSLSQVPSPSSPAGDCISLGPVAVTRTQLLHILLQALPLAVYSALSWMVSLVHYQLLYLLPVSIVVNTVVFRVRARHAIKITAIACHWVSSLVCYISTLRNNVRSRAWGAAIGCSYRVERCCIVKKGGGIIELEPCLTHSSTMEPTLAPVAVERTMTTRAAASNALRQQRFVREVTIQFNLCMEPWLKYSISAVADKGLKKSLFTSARLKKGEACLSYGSLGGIFLFEIQKHMNLLCGFLLEVQSFMHLLPCDVGSGGGGIPVSLVGAATGGGWDGVATGWSSGYELSFNGEKVIKAATAPHAYGAETGRTQTNQHLANGERNAVDGESTVVDIFRWSRCKRPLPQKVMQSIGIPLPLEHIEVLEENLEWDDFSWSQTGAWIAGREYHLARAHFLSPN